MVEFLMIKFDVCSWVYVNTARLLLKILCYYQVSCFIGSMTLKDPVLIRLGPVAFTVIHQGAETIKV